MNILEFRKIQSALVRIRDDELCQYCYRVIGVETQEADHVHHVLGRSRTPSVNETHEWLMCLCSTHHRDIHDGRVQKPKEMRAATLAHKHPVVFDFVIRYMKSVAKTDDFEEILTNAVGVRRKGTLHTCIPLSQSKIVWNEDIGFCPYCLGWFVVGQLNNN